MPSLRFHPFSLGTYNAFGLFEKQRLPDHRAELEHADYHEQLCEPSESVLYLEILSALLAGLITS
jgi:hypothetical protein